MASTTTSSVAVARIAAAAARDVPGVLGFHGGTVGEVATYGEGGRVPGVRVRRDGGARIVLHLVVQFGRRLDDLAEEVRGRVGAELSRQLPAAGAAAIDVHVADVRTEPVELPAGDIEQGTRPRGRGLA